MDFSLAPEHIELAGALRRWLAAHHDLPQRRRAIDAGQDPVWPALVALGVPSLAVGEAGGGFGGSAVDLLPTLHELGRALAITPFWSTAVGARAVEWGGTPALRERLLPRLADGSATVALALLERASRHDLDAVQAIARRTADGYALTGEKTVVLFGAQAAYWLVSARVESAGLESAGVKSAHVEPAGGNGARALFVVPAGAPNVRVTGYRCIDNLPAADLRFDGTSLAAADRLDGGAGLLHRVADFGAALLCAEAVGLMERARDATVAHLQTRQQFGAPLASFQALQHRIVEVTMQIEQARSMSYLAATGAASVDAAERVRCVAAAKAVVGEAALFVGRQCVQLHGAIGLTDETAVSHALKRLTMIDQTFGDADHHLARFAALPAAAH